MRLNDNEAEELTATAPFLSRALGRLGAYLDENLDHDRKVDMVLRVEVKNEKEE